MPEEVVVGEVVETYEGKMKTAGPEGAPNMVGKWLPHQVAAYGGRVREDTGVPNEAVLHTQSGRASAADGVPRKVVGAGQGRRRLAVVKGAEARKGMQELIKRYGVK